MSSLHSGWRTSTIKNNSNREMNTSLDWPQHTGWKAHWTGNLKSQVTMAASCHCGNLRSQITMATLCHITMPTWDHRSLATWSQVTLATWDHRSVWQPEDSLTGCFAWWGGVSSLGVVTHRRVALGQGIGKGCQGKVDPGVEVYPQAGWLVIPGLWCMDLQGHQVCTQWVLLAWHEMLICIFPSMPWYMSVYELWHVEKWAHFNWRLWQVSLHIEASYKCRGGLTKYRHCSTGHLLLKIWAH